MWIIWLQNWWTKTIRNRRPDPATGHKSSSELSELKKETRTMANLSLWSVQTNVCVEQAMQRFGAAW
jgi:hypothetical protein